MNVEDVKKLSPLDRFLYWISERHGIYEKRMRGEPKPWSDDKILQTCFFTNPYRENDKTTVWFRENIRQPLRDIPAVVFATICFRWFNYIPTGEILVKHSLHTNWNKAKAILVLSRLEKVFTGAFMIPAPPGSKKVVHVCSCLDGIWRNRDDLVYNVSGGKSLQQAHKALIGIKWLGNFMAYEVVTDLRHTYVLENAPDIMTWANPGPGCIRGLRRLQGLPLSAKGNSDCLPRPAGWQNTMQDLLKAVQERLPHLPPFEIREVEHSLCEFDKMERVLWSQGKAKRRYNGEHHAY